MTDENGKSYCYERKRGAILMFNDMIINGDCSNFKLTHLPEKLKNIEYVITLDEDTVLLPNEAAKMVGSLHHPLNRPIVEGSELIKGVSIMQPNIRTKLNDACINRFTYVFSGDFGYDRYSNNTNDFHMRAFNIGFFYGKGIYAPKAFNSILENKFPDNTILSDIIIYNIWI